MNYREAFRAAATAITARPERYPATREERLKICRKIARAVDKLRANTLAEEIQVITESLAVAERSYERQNRSTL